MKVPRKKLVIFGVLDPIRGIRKTYYGGRCTVLSVYRDFVVTGEIPVEVTIRRLSKREIKKWK